MKKSKLYLHASNLSLLAEDLAEENGDDSVVTQNITALTNLILGKDNVVTTPTQETKKIKKVSKKTTKKSSKKVAKKSDEKAIEEVLEENIDLTIDLDNTSHKQQLKAAYNILKDQSKPGPTYLSRAGGIPITKAKSLYAKLKRMGKFDKDTQPVKKEPTILELINGLPDGSEILVKPPFNYFLALPEGVRAKYLMGLNLEELVTSDALTKAVSEGADKTLVDEIHSLKGKKRPKVTHIITAIEEEGNATGDKYKKYINHYIKSIPNGKELYDHMTAGGLNKTILRDLKSIYQAVKKGSI